MTQWDRIGNMEPERKRSIYKRLAQAKKDRVPVGQIAAQNEIISIHTIYDMLEAKSLSAYVWEAMDDALTKIGY